MAEASVLETRLFLGFPVDSLYETELKKVSIGLLSFFIQKSDTYLTECSSQGLRFLGKKMENPATLLKIEQTELHIFSLLKKLVPDFPYEETPLYLFSIESD